jgi:hypothetical protein
MPHSIQDLASGLAKETSIREHRFLPGWVVQLSKRYNERPENPTVHLCDLTENSIVYLRSEGRSVVEPCWERLGVLKGKRWAWYNYRGIANYLTGASGKVARLKKWKDFAKLTGFDVNMLEPFVSSLRTSDGPYIRTLRNPKLPLNLATPAGARLIGYYGDSNNRNGAFTNKDSALHEDFRKTVTKVFGDLTMSETVSNRGGFKDGRYIRSNVGKIVPAALTVAGFDNTRDQKQANNPLPSWIFDCNHLIRSECLSALWDAEGSVNYRDLKIGQAIPVVLYPEETIPVWPSNKAFRRISLDDQSCVLEHPPLLLISAALLLYSLGIVSRIMPTKLSSSQGEITAYWQLRVQRDQSIKAFHSQIRLRSEHKQKALDSMAGVSPHLPL